MCLPRQCIDIPIKGFVIFMILACSYCYYQLFQAGMMTNLTMFIPLIVFLAVILIISCCSYCAVKKKNICLDFCTIVLIVIFIVVIGFFWKSVSILFESNQTCQSIKNYSRLANSFVDYEYDLVSNKSAKLLCSEKCPCNLNNTNLVKNITKKLHISDKGAVNVFKCPDMDWYKEWNKTLISHAFALGSFEMNFNCSGFCKTRQLYLFSDINRGKPQNNCFDMWRLLLRSQYSSYISLFYMIFFIMIIIALLICIKQCSRQDYEDIEETRNQWKNKMGYQFVKKQKEAEQKSEQNVKTSVDQPAQQSENQQIQEQQPNEKVEDQTKNKFGEDQNITQRQVSTDNDEIKTQTQEKIPATINLNQTQENENKKND